MSEHTWRTAMVYLSAAILIYLCVFATAVIR